MEVVEADQVLQVTTVAVAWEVLKSWCNSRNVHLHGENLMWSCHHLGNWPLWRGRGLGVWWRLALCICRGLLTVLFGFRDDRMGRYHGDRQLWYVQAIREWLDTTLVSACTAIPGEQVDVTCRVFPVDSPPWTLGRRRLIRTPHITKRTRRQSKKGVIRRRPRERPWLSLGSMFCTRFAKAASLLFLLLVISLCGWSKLAWTIPIVWVWYSMWIVQVVRASWSIRIGICFGRVSYATVESWYIRSSTLRPFIEAALLMSSCLCKCQVSLRPCTCANHDLCIIPYKHTYIKMIKISIIDMSQGSFLSLSFLREKNTSTYIRICGSGCEMLWVKGLWSQQADSFWASPECPAAVFSGIHRIHIPVLDHQKAEPRSVSLAGRVGMQSPRYSFESLSCPQRRFRACSHKERPLVVQCYTSKSWQFARNVSGYFRQAFF